MSDDNRIDAKLDKIVESISSIDRTLTRQEAQLAEHMRRTAAAEESINLLRADQKTVQLWIAKLEGGLKLLGLVSLVITIVAGVVKLFT